jgi:hypothetical protein
LHHGALLLLRGQPFALIEPQKGKGSHSKTFQNKGFQNKAFQRSQTTFGGTTSNTSQNSCLGSRLRGSEPPYPLPMNTGLELGRTISQVSFASSGCTAHEADEDGFDADDCPPTLGSSQVLAGPNPQAVEIDEEPVHETVGSGGATSSGGATGSGGAACGGAAANIHGSGAAGSGSWASIYDRGAPREVGNPYLCRGDVGSTAICTGNWGGERNDKILQKHADEDLKKTPACIILLQEAQLWTSVVLRGPPWPSVA